MTIINKYNHKKSRIASTLWLSMAVFFLVFCSSPVKKYIRLHLYNQKFVVENTKGDHYSTYDVKDCLIADRHQQTEINILSFVHPPSDDLQNDISFYTPSFLPPIAFTYCKNEVDCSNASILYGIAMPVPVYLWVRHLQV